MLPFFSPKFRRMTRMIRKLIIVLVFLIGLSVFSYPIVSNWLHSKEHYTVISNHNNLVQKMSAEEKAKEREKAQKYNENLNETAIPIEDPFAEGAADDSTVTGYYNVLDIGETMGNLEIPSIDVNLPIYHGVSEDVLQQGIGHMSNSSFPIGGEGSHTALTGHRGLPSSKLFRHLDKVKEDELFFIHMLDETLAYKIDDIQVVLPTETSWLTIEDDKDYVTLITCEPYMINTHRLLVRGERVPYEAEVAAGIITDSGLKSTEEKSRKTLFALGSAVIVTLLILYYVRKRKLEE